MLSWAAVFGNGCEFKEMRHFGIHDGYNVLVTSVIVGRFLNYNHRTVCYLLEYSGA